MRVDLDELEGESCVWVFVAEEVKVIVEVFVLKCAWLAH